MSKLDLEGLSEYGKALYKEIVKKHIELHKKKENPPPPPTRHEFDISVREKYPMYRVLMLYTNPGIRE